jgi:methylglutaconyl-CoA hydratase
MPEHRKVLYKTQEGIARLTLNRPEKRNALDAELINGIKDAMSATAHHAKCRVVLLTGAGKDFCAGADLARLEKSAQADVLENMDDARSMAELFLMMRHHPRPIVAAVQGRALAGGCGLATACDIILASESAMFGYPEVNIGFVPAMVMAILRRSVSEKAAFELVASGEVVPAARALELGLVHHVYPDDKFQTYVDNYVSRLAAKSSSALMLSKRLLYQMDSTPFDAALEAGIEINAIARMTEDCRNGIERFLKKGAQ